MKKKKMLLRNKMAIDEMNLLPPKIAFYHQIELKGYQHSIQKIKHANLCSNKFCWIVWLSKLILKDSQLGWPNWTIFANAKETWLIGVQIKCVYLGCLHMSDHYLALTSIFSILIGDTDDLLSTECLMISFMNQKFTILLMLCV